DLSPAGPGPSPRAAPGASAGNPSSTRSATLQILTFEVATGRRLSAVPLELPRGQGDFTPIGVWLSHDGRRVLAATAQDSGLIWDTHSGRRIAELPQRFDPKGFSALGQQVVGCDGNQVNLFDCARNRVVYQIRLDQTPDASLHISVTP